MPTSHSEFRDDRIILTEREWNAMIENMETLGKDVRKLEREQLIFKAKLAVWMCIFGSLGGVLGAVSAALILKHLP